MLSKALILSLFLFLAPAQRLSPLPRCTSKFREFDGVCTSLGRREQRLWGSTNRIYFQGRDSREPNGRSRPSARLISDKLFKQRANSFDRRGLNEMAAYFGQFIQHDVSITPMSDDERFDIPIPRGHKAGMFKGAIPFFRSIRGRSVTRDFPDAPVNRQTSALDLSAIYGASKLRNNALRTGIGGMMLLSARDLPSTTSDRRLENFPESSSDYFMTGDPRANENPVLTSLHTIFIREHNRIVKELAELWPVLSDEELFMKARSINSAQFQKIVFEEWFPAVTNDTLRRYRGFQRELDPTVSVTFSTAASQVYHSMIGRDIKRRDRRNVRMAPLKKGDSFFRNVSTLREDGVEPYLRGAFKARAQAIDAKVTETRRNQLYSSIRGLENRVDIVAEIIQRGRDHNIPSYVSLRRLSRRRKALMIEEVTTNPDTQKALKDLYGRPSSIDAYPGMLVEDHVEGSSMGTTLLSLWKAEFVRLRDGDRFYFRSNCAFPDYLRDVPTVKKLLSDADTFRRIVLDNTNVEANELPKRMFFVK